MEIELREFGTFWATIAQITATFVGLVLVAISIYTNQVREVALAIRRYPGFEEVSSPLIFSLSISNLALFVFPLFVAMAVLASINSLAIGALLVGLYVAVYLLTRATPTMLAALKLKRSSVLGTPHEFRLTYMKRASMLINGLVAILLISVSFCSLYSESLFWFLRALSVVSIPLGLAISLYDLHLFDQKNVVLRRSDVAKNQAKHRLVQLNKNLDYAEELLQTLFSRYLDNSAWQSIALKRKSAIRHAYDENRLRQEIDSRRESLVHQARRLRAQISTSHNETPAWFTEFMTDFVLYSDFLSVYSRYSDIRNEITSFQKNIEQQLLWAEQVGQGEDPGELS
jgi:hypothetical protein